MDTEQPETLSLQTTLGLTFVVPAALSCAMTYVLLEQERWYEREVDFLARWVRPGMTVVDVGAGLGAYALPLARAVGPEGRVVAYEAASANAALLEQSAARNKLTAQLTVRDIALSDRAREAVLFEGGTLTPKLENLGGPTEPVTVSTLDAEAARLSLERLDVLRLGAEGEAERTIAGAKAVIEKHSPLVVFTVRHADEVDLKGAAALKALGYGIYRMLGDASMLVPWREEAHEPSDLNLFAARPELAALMERLGVLASEARWPELGASSPMLAEKLVKRQPHLARLGPIPPLKDGNPFVTALAAYEIWRDPSKPAADRYGALRQALSTLQGLCALHPTPGALSTLARVAQDAGERRVALQAIAAQGNFQQPPRGEAFLTTAPRFERVHAEDRWGEWFTAQVIEQGELLSAYSSYYRKSHPENLDWLCRTVFTNPEILRRYVIQNVIAGNPHTEGLQALIDCRPQMNPAALKVETLRTMVR